MGSGAATRKNQGRGGSGTASSSLPFLVDGDLQNTQKRKQAIDFSFFFLVHGFVFLSLLLYFESASLYKSVIFFFFPILLGFRCNKTRGSSTTRLLLGLVGGDGSDGLVGGLGFAVLGLLAVASMILELTVALGCCCGVLVMMG